MTPLQAALWALAIAAFAGLALIALRAAWHRLNDYAARHIEHITRAALTRPDYRTIDDEYRALVLAAHDQDNL